MENPIIELKLPAASVQVVLNALGTRPLAEVFDTFVAVRSQAERALSPAAPPAAPPQSDE
jgi:hypothetical protein